MCSPHYRKQLKYGDPLAGPGSGLPGKPKTQRNSTGEYILGNYRRIRQDDVVGRDKWILEHRYVMEQQLGRKLLSNENIHHINGDTLDNRPGNLELWVSSQPSGQRVEDLLAWAHEIIELYGS